MRSRMINVNFSCHFHSTPEFRSEMQKIPLGSKENNNPLRVEKPSFNLPRTSFTVHTVYF